MVDHMYEFDRMKDFKMMFLFQMARPWWIVVAARPT